MRVQVPPAKEGKPFDSNTITPGTPFMDRLALFLRAFIHKKLSTDSGWRGIKARRAACERALAKLRCSCQAAVLLLTHILPHLL